MEAGMVRLKGEARMNKHLGFELTVSTSFDAAHRLLAEHYGTGTRLHGHTYNVVVTMQGNELREDGMLFNHYDVRAAIQRVIAGVHDRYLNEVSELQGLNSTPEVIAQYLWAKLEPDMATAGVARLSVEVAESATTKARYEAAVGDDRTGTP
jgi:6-pyruvoyltetrahydropterin/6-carboxytetrahydropterin synthase